MHDFRPYNDCIRWQKTEAKGDKKMTETNEKNIKFAKPAGRRVLDKLRFTQTPFGGKLAAVYVRVSSDMNIKTANGETEKRASVQTQAADGIAYAQKMGWSFKLYDADCNISGSEDISNRPALLELIADIKAGKVHTVICREFKRLFRHSGSWSWFRSEILFPFGVGCKSLTENVDITTAEGRLMASILGEIGQSELIYIAEKSMRNKQDMVEKGQLLTTPPFGYEIVSKGKTRFPVVVEAEAAIIRELFDRCASGDGLQKLLNEFQRRGIHPRRGKHLEPASILRWLRNPLYMGICRYNGKAYPSPFPPIVDAAIWEKANGLIDARASRYGVDRRAAANSYLLTGLIKCGYCFDKIQDGKTQTEANHKICANYVIGLNKTWAKVGGKYKRIKYAQYRCQTKFKHHAVSCPDSISLKAEYIESEIREWVGRMVANMTSQKPDNRLSEIDAELADISAKIVSLEARRKKAIAMYTAGTIEDKDLADITASVKRETAKAEAKIKDLQQQRNGISNGEQERALVGLAKWDSLSMADKKAGLQQIFDRILVYNDRLVIAYRWNPEATFSVPLKYVAGNGGGKGYQIDQAAALEQLTRPASGGLSMVGLDDLDKVA